MFDREYTLVVHPRVRARLSYRNAEGDLSAASLRVDYRRKGEWTEEEVVVDLPEHPEETGIEWQGFRFSLYRDGEQLLARNVGSSVFSDLIDAVDAVERYAPGVARKGKNAARRAVSRVSSGRVEMTQHDGSTVEALRPPAKATFEVYEGRDSKWRWRLRHDNGNVVADSGQGYSSKQAAQKGIQSVKRNALGAVVEENRVEGGTGTDTGSAES